MKSANGINLTMLCDFYELTMGNGYFADGMQDRICYFDIFYRDVPDSGGYAVAAGLEQIVDYVEKLHFGEEDIAYLRSRGIFSEGFLDYLRNFKFTGDIWAIPEGTPIFPMEPVITVRAPAIQAQLLETYLLLEFNHQSLIATKASRVCRAPSTSKTKCLYFISYIVNFFTSKKQSPAIYEALRFLFPIITLDLPTSQIPHNTRLNSSERSHFRYKCTYACVIRQHSHTKLY